MKELIERDAAIARAVACGYLTDNDLRALPAIAPAQIRADAIREAAAVFANHHTIEMDRYADHLSWRHEVHRAILALLDTQLCAECDCESGGQDCTWIATAPDPVANALKWGNEEDFSTLTPHDLMIDQPTLSAKPVDDKIGADAVAKAARLREALGILEDALQEAGDDYPGSAMQEWCQQQVKRARAIAEGEK